MATRFMTVLMYQVTILFGTLGVLQLIPSIAALMGQNSLKRTKNIYCFRNGLTSVGQILYDMYCYYNIFQ